MSKYASAIEINRYAESRDDQLNRLTRQLREANARNEKAFDQGAAMVVRALRNGATLSDVAKKIRWMDLGETAIPRTFTNEDTSRIAVPLEFEDSDEHTEPMVVIPFGIRP